MEILFIVCPYVTRHRLGSFPHCWTTFDHRCCFPSDSVPICLPLSLSVCFCPVRPPPPFSVNSLCSEVRLSGHPLPPLSVKQPVFSAFGCLVAPFRRSPLFLSTGLVLCFRCGSATCIMLRPPASLSICLLRLSPSASILSVHLLGSVSFLWVPLSSAASGLFCPCLSALVALCVSVRLCPSTSEAPPSFSVIVSAPSFQLQMEG